MVDAFVGKWGMTKDEKFDEYLKELGVGQPLRTLASTSKPDLHISQNGDMIQIKTVTTFKTTVLDFKLDEEFDETTADKRQVKSVVKVKNGRLEHTQKWDGKEATLVREVEGDNLTLTLALSFADVVSHRYYKKSA